MKYLVAISCLVAAVAAMGHSGMGTNMLNSIMGNNGMSWNGNMMGQYNNMFGQNGHNGGSMTNQYQIMQMIQSLAQAIHGMAEHRRDDSDDSDDSDDDDHRGEQGRMGAFLGGNNNDPVLSLITGLLLGTMDQQHGGRQGQGQSQGRDQGLGQLMELLGNGRGDGEMHDMVSYQMRDWLTKMVMGHMEYLETKKYFRASTMSLCLMVRAKAHMEMNNTESMIKELSDSDLMELAEKKKNMFEMLSEENLAEKIKEMAEVTDMTFEKYFYEAAALSCKSSWKYMQMRRKVDGKDDDDDDDMDWKKLMMLMHKLKDMKEHSMMDDDESGNGGEYGDQSGTESGDQSGTESGDQSGSGTGDASGSP